MGMCFLNYKVRTPDLEEDSMTPFSLTFIIPHLNSGRNLDAAEILGKNSVAFDNSSYNCHLRKKMWFRVRISESEAGFIVDLKNT